MSQKIEAGIKLWNCNDCGYARERKSDVTKHIERIHFTMEVSCQYCNAVFKNRISLKHHLRSAHGIV